MPRETGDSFEHALFFVGQTPCDATVVKDGEYVRIEAYRKAIAEAAADAPMFTCRIRPRREDHADYELESSNR